MSEQTVFSRPWGRYVVLHKDAHMWLKRLIIAPGAMTSLQYHRGREEYWYTTSEGLRHWFGTNRGAWVPLRPGKVTRIPREAVHRIENPTDRTLIVTEWAVGDMLSEDDIVRIADEYGRAQKFDN